MKDINTLKDYIKQANKIVIMTGAGMSVPSGIPDFRSANGLYNEDGYEVSPEVMLSHSFFMQYPDKFYNFYKSKMIYQNALPNSGHRTLAKLEKKGKQVTIVTQNIDGLHQKAGSMNVLELHGSVQRNYCMKCNKKYSLETILQTKGIPSCDCGGIIKPDVTLYEEALSSEVIEKSLVAIEGADLLIVIGTSLMVYPAASFIHYFKGNHFVIINKERTSFDDVADMVIHKPLEDVLTDDLLSF